MFILNYWLITCLISVRDMWLACHGCHWDRALGGWLSVVHGAMQLSVECMAARCVTTHSLSVWGVWGVCGGGVV